MSIGYSLSFNYEDLDNPSLESKEKLSKSVEPKRFFEFAPFVRSFGSSLEEEKDSSTTKKTSRKSYISSRKLSISSSTESMNSEITEMRSSQFECEQEITKKSCCMCSIL